MIRPAPIVPKNWATPLLIDSANVFSNRSECGDARFLSPRIAEASLLLLGRQDSSHRSSLSVCVSSFMLIS